MAADTTAPVVPSGGAQSLAGSPTYDAHANTQTGRLSRVVALHAGASEPSIFQIPAEWLAESIRKALGSDSRPANTEVIGLRPLVKDITLVSMGGPVPVDLQEVIDALSTADGVILASPVFQAPYSGLFKSAMDVLPTGTLEGAPVPLGAAASTARHGPMTEMALRPLVVYMKALPMWTAVLATNEDFGMAWQRPSSSERSESPLSERVTRAGWELVTLMERFPRQAPVDPLASFTLMETFLASR